MNSRQAKRAAHIWVAYVIGGALANGAGDDFGVDSEADQERIKSAIEELAFQHFRRGHTAQREESTDS